MSQDYILYLINRVTERINKEKTNIESKLGREISFDEYSAIALDCIYKKGLETGVIDREDQYLIGAILGNMFHQAYRETRKLDKPDKNGFMYNPREKELSEEIDKDFVQAVLDGKIVLNDSELKFVAVVNRYPDHDHIITINGGNVTIKASGDGIDSNGSLIINGAELLCNR